MGNDIVHGRQLMKDGTWLVPEEERPEKYFKKIEQFVSVSMTLTQEDSVKSFDDHPVQIEKPRDLPIISLLSDSPDIPRLAEVTIEAYTIGGSDEEWDVKFEALIDEIQALAGQIKHYRKTKVQVDLALSAWFWRNSEVMKRVGINTKAMRDLWATVHALCGK